MNTFMITLLSLSLSGAILIAVIYLLKPIYRERLSKTWQYYIWLIVIARLLLPFSLEFNLVGSLFDNVMPASVISYDNTTGDIVPAYIADAEGLSPVGSYRQAVSHSHIGAFESEVAAPNLLTNMFNILLSNIWIIWIVVAITLFVRKITIYQGFTRFIRAGRKPVEDMERLEQFGKTLELAGINSTVGLYTNKLVSSPLLIGFFKPYIVLPTLNISESDFKHTVLHELTHFRRGDMFYKWLVQFAVCLHWFNPLVHLMSSEISKMCEFSCDESVIKGLDPNAIKSYGDTLVGAIGIRGTYKNSHAAISLSGNVQIIKERLDMIKNFRRKSRLTIIVALLATLVLSIGAVAAGAYAMSSQSNSPGNTLEIIGEVINNEQDIPHASALINIQSNNQTNVVQSGSFHAEDNQELVLQIISSIRGGTVDLFLFAPDGTEHRFTIGATPLTERAMALTYGVWAYNAFGQFTGGDISIVGAIRPDFLVQPTPRPVAIPTPRPTQAPNNNLFNWGQGWNVNSIQGVGEMVPRSFETRNFTGIEVSLPADVTWVNTPEHSVNIVMQDNFFEYLDLYVMNGNLVIRSREQLAISEVLGNRPQVYIHSPYINHLGFSGAVSTVNWDTVYSGQSFTIWASGAVDVTLDLQVQHLNILGSGAVDFVLSGNAHNANISLSGAVDFHGFDLQIRNAEIFVSGSADIDVYVANLLSANMSGSANLRYRGSPTVTRSMSGDARVTAVQ